MEQNSEDAQGDAEKRAPASLRCFVAKTLTSQASANVFEAVLRNIGYYKSLVQLI